MTEQGVDVDVLDRRELRAGFEGRAVGDEGGFAPDLDSNEDAIKLLIEAVEKAGYAPGDDLAIALEAKARALHFCLGAT